MDKRPIMALLVEDDPDDARLLALRLSQCSPGGAPFKTRLAASLAEGYAALEEEAFDIVFLDWNLPDGCGLELLERLRGRRGAPEVVVYTGCQERAAFREALRKGAAAVLHKDLLDLSGVRRAVALAFVRRLTDEASRLVGVRRPSAT